MMSEVGVLRKAMYDISSDVGIAASFIAAYYGLWFVFGCVLVVTFKHLMHYIKAAS